MLLRRIVVVLLSGVLGVLGVLGADVARVNRQPREAAEPGDFTLSVVHLNDFHARFDPVAPEFTSCDPSLVNTCVPYPCPRGREDTCIGGLARVSAAMKRLKKQYPDSIVLNGGDNFQGSLYYHVHRHAIMSFFLNRLPYDAISLGNHEFDQGVDNVKEFIRRLSFPVLAANLNASGDPDFARLIQPSIVLERGGKRIGVIGYMLNNTAQISQTGALRFRNEWEAVNEEATRLKEQGVDIIVCVSHDGLSGDLEVAKRAPDVDLIVGGHSHTFLYSGPPPSDDLVHGEYPVVVVTQESGRKVLVVQAFAATKYLGHLLVTFDKRGEVTAWEGKPILLDNSAPQDGRIQRMLRPWRARVDILGRRRVGFLDTRLSQDNFECLTGECNIGNAVADAFVDHTTREGNHSAVTIGAVIGWSMVANLEAGVVTYEDVYNVLPYEYSADTVDITGKDLLRVLESSAAGEGLFQWSGVRMAIDLSRPEGQRVTEVFARTSPEQAPQQYPALEPARTYRMAAQSIALCGGYSNPVLAASHRARVRGPLDHSVFATYLSEHHNLDRRIEGRVTMVGGRAHPRRYSGRTLDQDGDLEGHGDDNDLDNAVNVNGVRGLAPGAPGAPGAGEPAPDTNALLDALRKHGSRYFLHV